MSAGEDSGEVRPVKRRRKVTDIAMQWLTQRLRRCDEIKEQLNAGTYSVDSDKVAASIANKE